MIGEGTRRVHHGIEIPLEALEDLCRRYQIKELPLFRSALREDFGPDSDLDIPVDFQPGARIGLFAYVRLQKELEELLGRNVDLVPKDHLTWGIRDQVLESTEVIYAV